MILEIKKMDIWSVIKLCFVIFLLTGFVFSLIWIALMTLLSGFVTQYGQEFGIPETRAVNPLMAFFGAIFLSVFYAIFMSLLVTIVLGLYNLIAKGTGGFRFEVNLEKVHSERSQVVFKNESVPVKEELPSSPAASEQNNMPDNSEQESGKTE